MRACYETKNAGQLDNTLVIFIMGDNGASAEGSMQGTPNEIGTAGNGVKESLPYLLSMMDELGVSWLSVKWRTGVLR